MKKNRAKTFGSLAGLLFFKKEKYIFQLRYTNFSVAEVSVLFLTSSLLLRNRDRKQSREEHSALGGEKLLLRTLNLSY